MCVYIYIYIYTFRIGQDKVEQVTLVPLCLFTFFGWEKLENFCHPIPRGGLKGTSQLNYYKLLQP